MEVTLNWYVLSTLIGLGIAWTGFLVGIIKWLIGRMIKGLEQQLDLNNKECTDKWERLEAKQMQMESRFMDFLERLPIDYQRREDSIREYTVINAKLDRQIELQMGKIKQ